MGWVVLAVWLVGFLLTWALVHGGTRGEPRDG